MGTNPLGRAVFLDRDGVLNQAIVRDGKPYPPAGLDDLKIVPEAAAALAELKRLGFLLLVVTNQPDVGRGTQTLAAVENIHQRLRSALPLDDIFTCYHSDADRCDCRKPSPGLVVRAARRHGVSLTRSYLIGDRWRDIDAGHAAGCKTILIEKGYRERPPAAEPAARVPSLQAAVDWIVKETTETEELPMTSPLSDLRVKLFADGADRATMLRLYSNPLIRGFTTNPTLMRKAGVADYERFARDILCAIPDRPVSFEVFADDFAGMEWQAQRIASWGENVYVKIPITNTGGESSALLLRRLARARVKVNVTAICALDQVAAASAALAGGPPGFISVFAGRIADTGRNPVPLMAEAVELLRPYPNLELIWASPRELLNIFDADAIGCHIITVTSEVLSKLPLVGKDLHEYSLDTVKMFYDDAVKSGFSLSGDQPVAVGKDSPAFGLTLPPPVD